AHAACGLAARAGSATSRAACTGAAHARAGHGTAAAAAREGAAHATGAGIAAGAGPAGGRRASAAGAADGTSSSRRAAGAGVAGPAATGAVAKATAEGTALFFRRTAERDDSEQRIAGASHRDLSSFAAGERHFPHVRNGPVTLQSSPPRRARRQSAGRYCS